MYAGNVIKEGQLAAETQMYTIELKNKHLPQQKKQPHTVCLQNDTQIKFHILILSLKIRTFVA
ncbi:MAG TPA: hypothetical protein DDX07_08055 [Porphyromonadaceae bacterium]|nr:hypothetical protein [Porphyromonadaceae bacterium]